MTAESSTAASSNRSGGGASADSYIGSLISLTSKSEIRYEGILYNINTEESSIGLRNVRSFGTEGRKKDGPQVPPGDKIYEYILFRGSDIKDLQVKASPPIQTTPPINNDPAIIQSHYPHPATTSTSLPTAPSVSLTDLGSHSAHMGHPGGSMVHQTVCLNCPSNPCFDHLQGLSMPPPTMQQMQYSGINTSLQTGSSSLPGSNLLELNSPLVPNSSSSANVTSNSLPFSLPPLQPLSLPFETITNLLPNRIPVSTIHTLTPTSSLPSSAPLSTSIPDNAGAPSVASKPAKYGPTPLPQHTVSHLATSVSGSSSLGLVETSTPSLVTPGQLLQSGPPPLSSTQSSQTAQKDVEVVQVSPKTSLEQPIRVATESQPPILPLPPSTRAHKPNGTGYHMRNNYRGRGGRGTGTSRHVTKFTEDFDFMAMNEKFNKDEVWGHLGKSNKSQSKEGNENGSDEDDDSHDEDDTELPKIEIQSVYKKDDFFDSISSNALDNESNHGRTRYSEQMKLDTETFGDFSRYRGGRGGRGSRGGGRFRGSYYGRGGYGGGYGYIGRGRGRGFSNRTS
ncbi:Protein decapping 5 [Abeliophyllum distichum]|uniref:Protein decapping 5 n=1 Tax=Abeliophyllum distichum TaxID=126358 RepID=A0ABD1U2C7_9LAMI